jgi:hypothetical protein
MVTDSAVVEFMKEIKRIVPKSRRYNFIQRKSWLCGLILLCKLKNQQRFARYALNIETHKIFLPIL